MTSREPQPDPRLPTLSRASHCQTFGMGHCVVCIYILTNVCINKQHLMLFDGACLVAQRVKNLPTMPETHIWSLGREDPLEKRMATHSSILACRIPWTEEPGRPKSMGLQRVGHNWATNNSNFSYLCCYSSYLSYYWHDLTLIHHNIHHIIDMMLHLSTDS